MTVKLLSVGPGPKSERELEQFAQRLRRILPPLAFDADRAPIDASDNYVNGWKVGSKWYDTTNHVIYECSFPGTPSSPSAVWQQMVGTNPTAGSGGVVAGGEALEPTDYIGVNNVSLGLNVRATIAEVVTASGVPLVAFSTIACTSGTNPVADTATDTLTMTAGTGITVTGNSATDTVTIASTVTGLTGTAQTYTESNVTTDRSYDANATTLDEIADVLGTLIADLRNRGIVL